MRPLPFILIEAGTAACSLFAIEEYPQLVDEYKAAQSAIQHHRITHIGHASTMLLLHAHHVMAQGSVDLVEPTGIERIPELHVPFTLHDFDIPSLDSMYFGLEPTPKNGRYKNNFTRTNTQPKRIERTTRSRP